MIYSKHFFFFLIYCNKYIILYLLQYCIFIIRDSYGVDGNQYFLPGCVPNPAIQHRWHILSYRAINPDKPLPAMENYLKKILEAPLIKERSKSHMQNIAQLFRLENIDLKAKKKYELHIMINMICICI